MLKPNRQIWQFCKKKTKLKKLVTKKPKKTHIFSHFEKELSHQTKTMGMIHY
jgi:hypothetical protein